MDESEREIVHPLHVVDDEDRRIKLEGGTMRGLEQANGLEPARVWVAEGEIGNERAQHVARRGERHETLRLVADDAKDGDLGDPLYRLLDEPRLPRARVADDDGRARTGIEHAADALELGFTADEDPAHARRVGGDMR